MRVDLEFKALSRAHGLIFLFSLSPFIAYNPLLNNNYDLNPLNDYNPITIQPFPLPSYPVNQLGNPFDDQISVCNLP